MPKCNPPKTEQPHDLAHSFLSFRFGSDKTQKKMLNVVDVALVPFLAREPTKDLDTIGRWENEGGQSGVQDTPCPSF